MRHKGARAALLGRKARYGVATLAVLLAGAVTACSGSSATGGSASAPKSGSSISKFPRKETLYTSGVVYAPPSNWNPLDFGNDATGTQGLIYEPLDLYDPVKNTYDPWLATDTPATGWKNKTYTINVRSGVKWSDGQPLTGADVAYSINLARTNSADPESPLVSTVANATASGNTVTVTFKGTPSYSEFSDYLWKAPVLPKHVWSKFPASKIATSANTNPVGTGPMTLDTYNAQEVAYKTKSNWWGINALGLKFKFKYLVDVVNSTNSAALGQFTGGQVDWSNSFLPGINKLMTSLGGSAYSFKTYYSKSPYMLSGNTVWLEPNTAVAPMNNVDFRRALAYALNPQAITQTVYGGIAQAANPTGLLPNLVSAGYLDNSAVSQYAATYNPAKAKQLLAKSGYHGQSITLQVPDGWSDWMTATQVIQQELSSVGIKIQLTYPQAPARTSNLTNGNYDLALDNNAGLDSTPWSYFQRVYQLPIEKQQTSQLNWERFNSPSDWKLVQEAANVPLSDTAKLNSIYSQLEKDFLQQQPEIPLWYNGIWFQANSTYWQNFPSSKGQQYVPSLWSGYLGSLTSVYALAELTPNPKAP